MRRTYPELEQNHIRPILKMVPKTLYKYNGTNHIMTFMNGSIIKFGHWAGEMSELEYQGLEFDWIFIDEATQFTERAFNYLGGCLRGVSKVPKRMYLTCNPGGVGHGWVKRLFIDRDFKTDPRNPECSENPDDYVFIPATVEDNVYLLEHSPGYLKMLASMPENVRAAYRYGDWNVLSGSYFPELRNYHLAEPFKIPQSWIKYRSIDYGLDMLSCLWETVDESGRAYVYREYHKSGLIVRDAAYEISRRTLPDERIAATFAPPDLWSRQKDTGRGMAELFGEYGVPLVKASNDRVAGHLMIKDALAKQSDGKPGLLFFDTCKRIVDDLRAIQSDTINPNDCATEPHDVTHSVDALRYFCVSRTLSSPRSGDNVNTETNPWDDDSISYEAFMTGA